MFSQDVLKTVIREKPVIQANNIYLRMIEKTDNHAIYKYASDPVVSKNLSWEPHQSLQDTHEFLSRYQQFLKNLTKIGIWYYS